MEQTTPEDLPEYFFDLKDYEIEYLAYLRQKEQNRSHWSDYDNPAWA